MKTLVLILIMGLIVSCNQSAKDVPAKPMVLKDAVPATSDSLFKVNGMPLLVQIRHDNERVYSLRTFDKKVILEPQDYYANLAILDINKDGFNDIRVFEISNTPNQCRNYFFDPKNKKFRIIQNSDLDIKVIPNTNFYFSYNRAGCADMNWESHLSKIEDFKEIQIGLLRVHNCGDENDGMLFYKIDLEGKKIKIDEQPVPEFDNNDADNKWDFMEKYWIENHLKYQ